MKIQKLAIAAILLPILCASCSQKVFKSKAETLNYKICECTEFIEDQITAELASGSESIEEAEELIQEIMEDSQDLMTTCIAQVLRNYSRPFDSDKKNDKFVDYISSGKAPVAECGIENTVEIVEE